MFSSISFLFLLSLAFIAWIILCYLKLIEEQGLLDDIRVELYTEHAQRIRNFKWDDKIVQCRSEPTTTSEVNKYLNLFWTFVCLCALTKLLKCFECYLVNRRLPAMPPPPPSSPPPPLREPPAIVTLGSKPKRKPLPSLKVKKSRIALVAGPNTQTGISGKVVKQLHKLESHCTELHKVLTEIKDSNNQLVHVNGNAMLNDVQASKASFNRIMTDMHSSKPRKPSLLPENIFITNSHIHISGPIFVNQRNINIHLPNGKPVCAPKQSEFMQIWGQAITRPHEPQPLMASMTRRRFLI